MGNKIRALIWEECRVGGVIALTCSLVGFLGMLSLRFMVDSFYLKKDTLFLLYVFAAPLGVAALLILTPDHRGSMRGGFARRILDLPVPTWAPVLIALVLRAGLVSASSVLILLAAGMLFSEVPGYELAIYFTSLYLAVQLLDWLRAPISGLSSLLALGVITWFIAFFATGANYSFAEWVGDVSDFWAGDPIRVFIGAVLFFALVCCVSLLTVGATRRGRRVGIPDIWQWHTYLSVANTATRKPFSSPVAAQVWMDLCKSYFLLPVVTVVITFSTYGVFWIYWKSHFSNNDSFIPLFWGSLIPFAAMSTGIFSQVLVMNVLPYRSTKGMPGYSYLLPMTDEQFAYARVLTMLILFLPTITFVTIVHFTIPSSYFVTELIPLALEQGVTSYREVTWTLFGRSLFVGMLLWSIMSVSTRLIGYFLGAVILASMGLGVLEYVNVLSHTYVDVLMPIAMVLLCAGGYIHAWRSRLIGPRSLILWAVVWILSTWVVFGRPATDLAHVSAKPSLYFAAFLSSLAIGALAPLPFVSILLDIRKKRHSAAPRQNLRRSISFNAATLPHKKIWTGVAACTALFLIWLGWPASPVFEDQWRSNGYPATLAELDEWYATVPDDENRALKYMSIVDEKNKKSGAFNQTVLEIDSTTKELPEGGYFDLIYVAGGAEYRPDNGIPNDEKEATEHYWREVSQHFAPRLREIANDGDAESRYPLNLLEGQMVELDMLAQLRDMARQLTIDAYHWTFENDSTKATDSLLAIFPVAESLHNEPVVISGLVRIAILGICAGGIEATMNMTTYHDSDLVRIQNELESLVKYFDENPILKKALVGESVITMNTLAYYSSLLEWNGFNKAGINYAYAAGLPALHAINPRGGEIVVSGTRFIQTINNMQEDWFTLHESTEDEYWESIGSMAILSMILMPALDRADEAAWRVRTQFDMAITGVAVERYRIAKGEFPGTLDALVPEFLDRIPIDKFDPGRHPLRYRVGDDGEAIVYSVSRNMVDDGGIKKKNGNWFREGDMTFTVYPNKSNDMEYVEGRKK